MTQRIEVERYQTQQHAEAQAGLHELALKTNRATVLLMLSSKQTTDEIRITQYRIVTSQLLSALGTLSTLLEITEDLSLRMKEALALARVYYETCLLAAFLSVDGGERANRAELHAIYKTFRKQTEVYSVAGQRFKLDRQPRMSRDDPRVREALSMFGGTSNVRPCFRETRDDMIGDIAAAVPPARTLFGGVEAMIHDLSSEIIHGSYYGTLLFSHLRHPSADELTNLQGHFDTVLFTICLCTSATAQATAPLQFESTSMQEVSDHALKLLLPHLPDEMKRDITKLMFNSD